MWGTVIGLSQKFKSCSKEYKMLIIKIINENMIYTYVYPVEGFDRNIADDNLIKAHLEGNNVKRFTIDEFIEELNNENINPVNYWVRAIEDNEGFHSIATVHIDHLKLESYDVRKVTESDMKTLAEKLSDSYYNWSFWEDLRINADDMDIPRLNKAKK